MIGFKRQSDDIKKDEEFFARIVRELSGDWITEVDCADIQQQGRRNHDEIVYFGPKSELEKDGRGYEVINLSIVDRYNFDEQRVSFLYNEDPECREAYDLDPKKSYVAFLNGEAQS